MKREDEILEAARTRAERHRIAEMELYAGDKCNYSYGRIYNSEIASYEAGAKYADEHPKSTWINVKDDLPCNHEEFTRKSRMSTKIVLVRTRKATYFVNYMIKEKSKWEWFCAVDDTEDEIVYWMPIPELPKE